MSRHNIVVGVTGSIAAYKAADLVSSLKKLNISQEVVMTKSAQEFIGAMTFEGITGSKVHHDIFDKNDSRVLSHITLAKNADLIVIAPATANIIAKMAHGIADDLLTSTVLASTCKVLIAPAMNVHMYENPQTQENIAKLRNRGYIIIEPQVGKLACGDVGTGKLADVKTLVDVISYHLSYQPLLKGKKVIVTGGASRESIDPVRFLTNRSTGKMGHEIAKVLTRYGADVKFISSNPNLPAIYGADTLFYETTDELHNLVMTNKDADIFILASAPSDYAPKVYSKNKIKKTGSVVNLELVRTIDIAKAIGSMKQPHQKLVCFAAESENLLDNAREKLLAKNADFIVANDITFDDSGFASDFNTVSIMDRNGEVQTHPRLEKSVVAEHIVKRLLLDF